MALIGTIENYIVGEDFDSYIERMDQLLDLNGISENEKKVALFINMAGGELYKVLKSIVIPKKPTDLKTKKLLKF